jgi:Zn-dependent protease with chaperone function
MRWEVFPLLLLSSAVVVFYKFKTEFLNLVVPTRLLNLEAFSAKEERIIGRKLAGLIAQSHSTVTLRACLIESQIVGTLYEYLLSHCHELGLLPHAVKRGELVLYYSELSSTQNYHQLYILPNGALVLSESLLERLLATGGIEALGFALLHELAHVAKRHTVRQLRAHGFGDLRRQYFLFGNQYIGFDALFMDYYTNSRYTLD